MTIHENPLEFMKYGHALRARPLLMDFNWFSWIVMDFNCFFLCFSMIFDMLSLHYWFRTHGFQDPHLFFWPEFLQKCKKSFIHRVSGIETTHPLPKGGAILLVKYSLHVCRNSGAGGGWFQVHWPDELIIYCIFVEILGGGVWGGGSIPLELGIFYFETATCGLVNSLIGPVEVRSKVHRTGHFQLNENCNVH